MSNQVDHPQHYRHPSGADTMSHRRFLIALIDGTIDEAMAKHLADMCKAEADALPVVAEGS